MSEEVSPTKPDGRDVERVAGPTDGRADVVVEGLVDGRAGEVAEGLVDGRAGEVAEGAAAGLVEGLAEELGTGRASSPTGEPQDIAAEPGATRIDGIAEIPFPEVEPLCLLGFDPARSEPEMEYDAFGHAALPMVELISRGHSERGREGDGQRAPLRVGASRLFALHSADDGEAYRDDIDLEFWVDDETAIVVSLARFLERRAQGLLGGARALVLALCNPYRARLSRPIGVDVPIFYAEGDVVAYFEIDPELELDAELGAEEIQRGKIRVQLVAERWREIP